eukprot:scpid101814/ scgid23764/ 
MWACWCCVLFRLSALLMQLTSCICLHTTACLACQREGVTCCRFILILPTGICFASVLSYEVGLYRDLFARVKQPLLSFPSVRVLYCACTEYIVHLSLDVWNLV